MWRRWAKLGSWLLGFWAWHQIFRLFLVTIVTYLLRQSQASLSTVSGILTANEIPIAAGSMATFYFLLKAFQSPLSAQSKPFEWKLLGSGMVIGMVGAILYTLVLVYGHYYSWLGLSVDTDQSAVFVLRLLFRFLTILALIYSQVGICINLQNRYHWHRVTTAVVFAALSWIPFDIPNIEKFAPLIFGLFLFLAPKTAQPEISFPKREAGILIGLLVVLHTGFSLPLFGSEFRGLFLVESLDLNLFRRLLTGGENGPLSSFAFHLSLIILMIKRVNNRELAT